MKKLILIAILMMTTTLAATAGVSHKPFGKLPNGAAVTEYTLDNGKGVKMSVIDFGGIITRLETADKAGKTADIVLGFTNIEPYEANKPYFGALIGRFGNRIGKAKFSLDGKTYTLAANNGPNTLHGGLVGFDKVLWKVTPFTKGTSVGLT